MHFLTPSSLPFLSALTNETKALVIRKPGDGGLFGSDRFFRPQLNDSNTALQSKKDQNWALDLLGKAHRTVYLKCSLLVLVVASCPPASRADIDCVSLNTLVVYALFPHFLLFRFSLFLR